MCFLSSDYPPSSFPSPFLLFLLLFIRFHHFLINPSFIPSSFSSSLSCRLILIMQAGFQELANLCPPRLVSCKSAPNSHFLFSACCVALFHLDTWRPTTGFQELANANYTHQFRLLNKNRIRPSKLDQFGRRNNNKKIYINRDVIDFRKLIDEKSASGA